MSLKTMLAKRSANGNAALLHGSDIPAGTTSITITIAGVREAPATFDAPLILDLKVPVYDKTAWAVNKSNLRILANLFGDDEQSFIGKKIKLLVISVRNPRTNEIVPSLAVSSKQ